MEGQASEVRGQASGNGGGADWQQVMSLQRLVDELRQRLRVMEGQASEVRGHDSNVQAQAARAATACEAKGAKLRQDVAQLQMENQKLKDTLDILSGNVREQRQKELAQARGEAKQEFDMWRGKLQQQAAAAEMEKAQLL